MNPEVKTMRPRSKKRAKQEREYLKLREEFLTDKVCQVCMALSATQKGGLGFNMRMATEIHHKKGRIGDLLTDTRYFLAVCRYHHQAIEINPLWAKENGYSLSRLSQ